MPFYKEENVYVNKYKDELKFKYPIELNNKIVNPLDFKIIYPSNMDLILSEYKNITDFGNIIFLYNHINGKSYKFELKNENIKKFIRKYFELHNKTIEEIYKKININEIITNKEIMNKKIMNKEIINKEIMNKSTMNEENIEELNKIILNKYNKYKSKYLKLKNKL